MDNMLILEKNKLKEYLEQARLLEVDLYTIDKAIEELNSSKRATYGPYLRSICDPGEPPTEPIKPTKEWIGFLPFILLGLTFIGVPFIISLLIGGAVALWRIHKNTEKYHSEYEQYKRKLNSYNYDKKKYEENFKKSLDDIVWNQLEEERYEDQKAKDKLYNEVIDKRISSLEVQKRATASTLRQLYELNVIHPLYRALIPISMFCKYMDTGLRTTLTGTNGMYDLYETELRHGIILGELKAINENLKNITAQLDSIHRNQKLILEAIKESNRIAVSIKEGNDKMVEQAIQNNVLLKSSQEQLNSIRESSAQTALNSELMARRAETIEKIKKHEFAERHPLFPNSY